MEKQEFIENIASVFEDKESINLETNYREHSEWCSIIALSVMAVVRKKYKISLKSEDLRSCSTFEELYNLAVQKQ